MEAKVNEGCISCGACVAACPEVFRFNDDGEAEAYEKVEPEYEKTAKEAYYIIRKENVIARRYCYAIS